MLKYVLLLTVFAVSASANNIGIGFNKQSDKVEFAANEIMHVLKEKQTQTHTFSISDLGKMRDNQINIILISKNITIKNK